MKHWLRAAFCGFSSLALVACNCTYPAYGQESLTRYLSAPVPLETVSLGGANLSWYAAIRVSAAAPGAAAGQKSQILTNATGAKGFLDAIGGFLGMSPTTQGYTFVVKPEIAGVQLPPMTPLKLTLEGGQPHIELASSAFSPWVPFEKGSAVSFELLHSAAYNAQFDLFQRSTALASQISTVAGWGVSTAVQGALNLAARPLDEGFRGLINRKATAQAVLQYYPFQESIQNAGIGQPRGYKYTLRDTQNAALAEITIEVMFRLSLREPPTTSTANGNYPLLQSAASSLDAPAYRFLAASGDRTSVRLILDGFKSIQNQLKAPAQPSDFIDACNDLTRQLLEKGFNQVDTTIIATKWLRENSDVLNRADLYDTLWRDCLNSQETIAAAIGVKSTMSSAVVLPLDLSATSFEQFGKYIVSRGSNLDAKNLAIRTLGPAVSFKIDSADGIPYTRQQAIDHIGRLSGISRYHCVSGLPRANAGPKAYREGFILFLRRNNLPDQVLAIYGPADGYAGAQATLVELRSPSPDEFKECKETEERRGNELPRT